jgi:hypothetical protein
MLVVKEGKKKNAVENFHCMRIYVKTFIPIFLSNQNIRTGFPCDHDIISIYTVNVIV